MPKLRHIAGVDAKLFLNATARVTIAAALLLSAAQIRAQSHPSPAPDPKPEYEIVSIKPTDPNNRVGRSGLLYTPDGFTAKNVGGWALLRAAYEVENYQISGAPKWFDTDHYDIEAKMPPALADEIQKLGLQKSQPLRQQMMQALLADRFNFTAHRETKDVPIYSLVIAKSGSKLQEPKPDETYEHGLKSPEGQPYKDAIFFSGRAGSLTITAQAASMTSLVGVLSGQLNRPVIDKTGLTGFYDFSFPFAPEDLQSASVPSGAVPAPAAPESNLPTLTVAIEEHLGLKLESGKGPAPIIVIDRIEKPSGN